MAKKEKKITEEELIGRAGTLYSSSVNWRDTNVKDRWLRDNDLYDSQFSRDKTKKSDTLLGQGRLFIPKTYSHVQRMLVDILEAFFFDSEEIISISAWKNIPSEVREIVKTLLNYRLNKNPINFYAEAYEACLDALKVKIGIFKVYPDLKIVDDRIVSFVPRLECIPYEDCLFSPMATWKDYWQFPIIHRMVKSIDYLKRQGYKNIDKVQDISNTYVGDEFKDQRNDGNYSPFVAEKMLKVTNANRVFVYEIWDFLDVNNDGLLESCSYLMAGDSQGPKILIREVEENALPYKRQGDDYNRPPIVLGNAMPEPHKLMGKSVPEIVEGLQRETNSLRNQRREAVALALRKPMLAARSAGIDLVSLTNRRIGAVVMGDDVGPNSVRELQMSDPTNSTVQEQQTTDQDFYETTSIPPNLLGMPSSPDETATAVTSHTANATKKISMTIKSLSETLFIPAFQMLLRLEQTYETDAFIQLVTGRKLGWLLSNDNTPANTYIQGEFDLTINTGINKQIQLNKWMMMLDRGNMVNIATAGMVQNGVVQATDVSFFDAMTVFKKMLPILGEKEIEEFMVRAKQPPMVEGGGVGKGVASQPGLPSDVMGDTMNMNPEMMAGDSYGQ